MGDFLRKQYDKQSCNHTVIISMYSSNEIEKVKELLEGNGYTVISYLLSNPSPNQLTVQEAEAEKKKIAAEAEAEATLTKALAQAEANEKLNNSLSKNLIDYEAIQKWNGEMPKVSGSNGTIIDGSSLFGTEKESE